jgi:hypothetical protein
MPETPNRAEVARRAEKVKKLLQKGKTADARAEYLQILESEPLIRQLFEQNPSRILSNGLFLRATRQRLEGGIDPDDRVSALGDEDGIVDSFQGPRLAVQATARRACAGLSRENQSALSS